MPQEMGAMDKLELQECARLQKDLLADKRYKEWLSSGAFFGVLTETFMTDSANLLEKALAYIDVLENRSAQLPLEQAGRTCPYCKGQGETRYHSFTETCRACRGSGQVR